MALAFERPLSRNIHNMDSGLQRPQSALTRGVQITELSDGCTNPEPIVLQESDILMEKHLSITKLQVLTGCDNLENVTTLELKVDTSETTLNNFGAMIPNLTVLKLTGSFIPDIRDLGSSLRNLRVLWMSRCGLEALDGISSMLTLQELYLAYNEISDISPVSMLEELEVLDLEGNNVDDIGQVQYLTLCPKLMHLTLDGNPICVTPTVDAEEVDYDYRKSVKKLLTNLSTLDDKSFTGTDNTAGHNAFDADWAYLEELQKDALIINSVDNEQDAGPVSGRPTTAALRPATAYRPGSALRPSSGYRPMSGARRPASISGGRPSSAWTEGSKQRPASSDAVEGMESASDLTRGVVICGNPSKALRARRKVDGSQENNVDQAAQSHGAQPSPEFQDSPASQVEQRVGSHSVKSEEEEESADMGSAVDKDLSHLMEELQSWKQEHEKRLQQIRESKAPQVLKIDYNSGGDLSDGENDSDDSDLLSDSDVDKYYSQEAVKAHRNHKPNIMGVTTDDAYFGREGAASFTEERTVENSATKKPNQMSSQKLKQYEAALVEDDHLLREYKRLEALEREQEKLQGTEHSPREQGRLRELRVPSAGPRPGTPRALVNPKPAPFPTNSSDLGLGHDSLQRDRPRKIRIGPTGLPGSSHSQQPKIREVLTPQTKPTIGGMVLPSGQRPSSSSASALQHRIRRTLPEVPSLPSRPPPVTRS